MGHGRVRPVESPAAAAGGVHGTAMPRLPRDSVLETLGGDISSAPLQMHNG